MSTMSADWRSGILDLLSERDEREKQSEAFYDSYSNLALRTVTAEKNASVSKSGSVQTTQEIEKLRGELDALYKYQASAKSTIEKLQVDNDKLTIYSEKLINELDKLTLDKKKIDSKLRTRDEEFRERNKTVQVLQDEILTYQIQLNVAEDKMTRLENENRELVKRWMERVSREAEKLNDANAFLERFVHSKLILVIINKTNYA
ncbi:autophagy-related protein 16 [Dipodascopsis uninucleata]